MHLNDDPFFSIVTITLNDRDGFCHTRESVEAQSIRDFEWIVIDGASVDGTVAQLEACVLPYFHYVSEKDRGLYNAMNKGLQRSRGQYVIFMNSGDCFASPTVLEIIKREIIATGQTPGIVYGDALEETVDGKVVLKKARPIKWLNYGMHTHHQAILYSRASLANLRYDESFEVAGDYDLTCRVYRTHCFSLAIDFPICTFSLGGLSEIESGVGRCENWRIQRDVLKHSLIHRMMTLVAYLVSHLARGGCKPIYDWMRFQHDPSQN